MYIGKKSIRFYKEDYNPQRHKIKYFTMNVDDRFAGTLLEKYTKYTDMVQIRVQITMNRKDEKITRIKYVGENLVGTKYADYTRLWANSDGKDIDDLIKSNSLEIVPIIAKEYKIFSNNK